MVLCVYDSLLHEYFHLAAIGNGTQLLESDLDIAAGGEFAGKMRTACGPEN